ncbi:hypothetical protein BDZ94DRAFT_1166123 [Collybia nuda]|uniref:Uncharacterized protein n=1 Tax=Collybia nuda TaxID=64659 RepID=A0A9P5Y6P0_9AGAR|nr:hypothetical protein BDZ94DRAFT_1166123 [Collybia nuda]
MSFPSPIGGTSFPADFAPSILFAVLYALLVPLMLYRVYDKRSRTTLLIGSVIFGVERVVIFSLRAAQSHNESKRLSKGLLTYMQISFGMGFIGIANDLVNIMRILLVNASYGSETYVQSPASIRKTAQSEDIIPRHHSGDFEGEPPSGTPDHPRQRFWSRRFSDFTNLAFFAATVPGIIANSRFSSVLHNPRVAARTMRLRYVSCGVALFLTSILAVAAFWARVKLARASRRGTLVMFGLTFLLSIIAVYRLAVMFHTTTELGSTAPGSLNSPGAKASFYILHVLPEWLATATLFTFNIRRMYGTGLFGDWRYRDETPKEREKREKREAKRAERRRQKLGTKRDAVADVGQKD